MDILIRPVRVEDSEDISEIRRMKGVMENILVIPSERLEGSIRFTESLGNDDHVFVAEVNEDGVKK